MDCCVDHLKCIATLLNLISNSRIYVSHWSIQHMCPMVGLFWFDISVLHVGSCAGSHLPIHQWVWCWCLHLVELIHHYSRGNLFVPHILLIICPWHLCCKHKIKSAQHVDLTILPICFTHLLQSATTTLIMAMDHDHGLSGIHFPSPYEDQQLVLGEFVSVSICSNQ